MKRIDVAQPCPVGWDNLSPVAGARHCKTCDTHVVDLTRLDARELGALITLTGGKFCGHQLRPATLAPPTPRSPFMVRALVGGAIALSAITPVQAAGPDPAPPTATSGEVHYDGFVDMPEDDITRETLVFAKGQTKLDPTHVEVLTRVAKLLTQLDWIARVEVDASASKDEAPTSALARATAVQAKLVALGVTQPVIVQLTGRDREDPTRVNPRTVFFRYSEKKAGDRKENDK